MRIEINVDPDEISLSKISVLEYGERKDICLQIGRDLEINLTREQSLAVVAVLREVLDPPADDSNEALAS